MPVADVLARGRPPGRRDEWRQVTATGTYDAAHTVVVRYQTRDGASGVDVVVPLVTADGTALLVDRGWLATDNPAPTTATSRRRRPGRSPSTGWVRADATGDRTQVATSPRGPISSAEIGPAIGQPGVRRLRRRSTTESPAPAEPLAPAELPDLDNGPHFFYGLQWWFFGRRRGGFLLSPAASFVSGVMLPGRRRDAPRPVSRPDRVAAPAAAARSFLRSS